MKSTRELIDEHLAKYPPESFALHEIYGAAHPTLTPRQQVPPDEPPGVTAMTEMALSREDIDDAVLELAGRADVPVSLVREAVDELTGGGGDGNAAASLTDEAEALTFIASKFGIGGSATMPGTGPSELELSSTGSELELSSGMEAYAAQEVARLAGVAHEKVTGRDGQVRERYMVDPVKANEALLPRPPTRPVMPDALMSDGQAHEVDRYLALSQNTRKADYPAVASRRDRDRGVNVELAASKVGRYLELAEDGSTTVCIGDGPDYHETSVDYDDTDTSRGCPGLRRT
jgi:hypothetical protein